MRPPEFTGGNTALSNYEGDSHDASMRPPEFTGGNNDLEEEEKKAMVALQ